MTRSSLQAVRPGILRQYYERTFGEGSGIPAAYLGTTPEEYVALRRIEAPEASARSLLANSPPSVGHRAVADAAPDDALPYSSPTYDPRWERIAGASVDLADETYSGRRVWVQGVGVKASGRPTPSRIWLTGCGATRSASSRRFEPPLELIHLTDCDDECDAFVVGHMSARALVWQKRDRPVSVAPLAAWIYLDYLRVDAPLIRDLRSLSHAKLNEVVLVRVASAEELREGLRGSWATLRKLMVATVEPLRPADVEVFSRLERLRIPAIPDLRDEWIDWAVRRTDVGCVFDDPHVFAAMTGPAAFERYKGVFVFRDPGGRAPRFRIEHDFIDEFDLEFDDNGDLEDALRARAKKAKLKLKWGSEASTLVATSTHLDEIHWVIDTCEALRGSDRRTVGRS